jgi:Protein of unknown function DUF262
MVPDILSLSWVPVPSVGRLFHCIARRYNTFIMTQATDEMLDAPDPIDQEPEAQELELDSPVEKIESEIEDATTSPAAYEIVSIPSDFTLEGLVLKWNKKPRQLEIPGFQRKFVWTHRQASRLIESFLLGLPVPALFLYADPDTGVQQVIDGQQRLMSVIQFFEGQFKNASMKKGRRFRLVGLAEGSPYSNCTSKDLEKQYPGKFAKLNDAVMRAFSIKQLDPNDATSIYHIFERLNTGGSRLIGQEIRNCVYHGTLNELINALNGDCNWRMIIGKPSPDSRMRDVEMILRFVALYFYVETYKKPMKDFLSTAMKNKRNLPAVEADALGATFRDTCARIIAALGDQPFHGDGGKMNPAVFDAVFTTIARHAGQLPADVKDRHDALLNSKEFKDNASHRTTDVKAVEERFKLARTLLFGA